MKWKIETEIRIQLNVRNIQAQEYYTLHTWNAQNNYECYQNWIAFHGSEQKINE